MEANDQIRAHLMQSAERIMAEMQANAELCNLLPTWRDAMKEEAVLKMLNQMMENVEQWKEEATGPIQALYFEYGGDGVMPFDSCALCWGFGSCNANLEFKKMVLQESGELEFELFGDMESYYKKFKEHYENIKLYLGILSFISLNIAMHRLTERGEFEDLQISFPFYVLGCEHDNDPQLIYKRY